MAFNYRLIVTYSDGSKEKFGGKHCHATKSLAGTLFQRHDVSRVCVADVTGVRFLYLVKGRPDKTENVASEFAPLG